MDLWSKRGMGFLVFPTVTRNRQVEIGERNFRFQLLYRIKISARGDIGSDFRPLTFNCQTFDFPSIQIWIRRRQATFCRLTIPQPLLNSYIAELSGIELLL